MNSKYTVEIDEIGLPEWNALLNRFDDSSIYQSSCYAESRWRRSSVSRMVVRHLGEVVAAVQVRLVKMPMFGGMGYVLWGPMWKPTGEAVDLERLKAALYFLKREYIQKRKIFLRIIPNEFTLKEEFIDILHEYEFQLHSTDYTTFVVDLRPTLEEIRMRLAPRWRTDLNRAEKNDLEFISGDGILMIDEFGGIYKEMFERKGLSDVGHLDVFRAIQKSVPDHLKMKVMLCKSNGKLAAGTITSGIGKTGLAILWATSMEGRICKGAYLLQWKTIEWLKEIGCSAYDVGGVNQIENPGGYRFKKGLVGKKGMETTWVGRFDSRKKAFVGNIADWMKKEQDRIVSISRQN